MWKPIWLLCGKQRPIQRLGGIQKNPNFHFSPALDSTWGIAALPMSRYLPWSTRSLSFQELWEIKIARYSLSQTFLVVSLDTNRYTELLLSNHIFWYFCCGLMGKTSSDGVKNQSASSEKYHILFLMYCHCFN